jgi:hypothetical protein
VARPRGFEPPTFASGEPKTATSRDLIAAAAGALLDEAERMLDLVVASRGAERERLLHGSSHITLPQAGRAGSPGLAEFP